MDIERLLGEIHSFGPFTPYSRYSEASETLTVYFRGDADYARQVSPHLTLFLSLDKHELVGLSVHCPRAALALQPFLMLDSPPRQV